MKILICPDSFKGSLSAKEVANTIRLAMGKILRNTTFISLPMADGGEGTVDALLSGLGGKKYKVSVCDPLGRKIIAEYALLSDGTGVMEMASASGLPLLKAHERNPLITSTYGTGQMILEMVKKKVKHIVVGVGGSATVDGGMGMAKALGVKFYSKSGKELREGGGFLGHLAKIDVSGINRDVLKTKVTVLCDVNNPLIGKHGASRVFGPQKGATKTMVELLDRNLHHYATIIKKQLKKDVELIPGAGAAGGLAAGLLAFLNANLVEGAKYIAEKIQLEKHIKESDIIITGEGKIDSQVKFGKTILHVIETAKKHNKPVIALCGQKTGDTEFLRKAGLTAIFSIVSGPTFFEEAIKNAKLYLQSTSREIACLIKCFSQIN
ncbi:MAG TPA: glycerate kinase [bacterium]|nr:glycerate kinase [bacterium]HOL34439.1 glycerate kinase [bacterium]HPP08264.1 glycerate kinase [bacterium]